MFDKFGGFPRHHAVWLGIWTLLGAALRFTNLSEKPPWTDEFATFVFSLGRSFHTVPLDQVMSLETLLKPVRVLPPTGVDAVVQTLLTESNHPPLYFILTHWWLRLVPGGEPWISVGVARSLAAVFGVALIPLMFWLGRFTFRSWRVAHLSALLMACSPFAVYLSQEARHYTLPMVWIGLAIACLVQTVRCLDGDRLIPYSLVLAWMGVHALGIATHYFMVLTIAAEAIALGLMLWHLRDRPNLRLRKNLGRIGWVALGTVASGLVWLPFFQESQAQSGELTRWIYTGDRQGGEWLAPLGQLAAGLITQLYMLPIQSDRPAVVIASGLGLVLLTLVTAPLLWRGWKSWVNSPEAYLSFQTLTAFVVGAIALFLGITYGAGIDVTSAFRYNFVYFPGVLLLLAAGLAGLWPADSRSRGAVRHRTLARWATTLVLVFSLLGGIAVIANLGYQKTHRPDLVAQDLWTAAQANPGTPHLVAIAHRTHGQTGRLMAIAWAWQHLAQSGVEMTPEFLLLHQSQMPKLAVNTLEQVLSSQPKPLSLWLINMQQIPQRPLNDVLQRHCRPPVLDRAVDGYDYQYYVCFNGNK